MTGVLVCREAELGQGPICTTQYALLQSLTEGPPFLGITNARQWYGIRSRAKRKYEPIRSPSVLHLRGDVSGDFDPTPLNLVHNLS